MSIQLFLPLPPNVLSKGSNQADKQSAAKVAAWISDRVERARLCWRQPSKVDESLSGKGLPMLADGIANILTQRVFNFQARGRLTMLLVQVRENLERQLRKGEPLNFFLLYNGGYRAAPLPSNPLIFAPDQTELMLLHQIALLHQKVSATYPPGIRFFIVINNGVGLWVNDMRCASFLDHQRRKSK